MCSSQVESTQEAFKRRWDLGSVCPEDNMVSENITIYIHFIFYTFCYSGKLNEGGALQH